MQQSVGELDLKWLPLPPGKHQRDDLHCRPQVENQKNARRQPVRFRQKLPKSKMPPMAVLPACRTGRKTLQQAKTPNSKPFNFPT
jgi:hypothetical protein